MLEQFSTFYESMFDQFWLLLPIGIIGLWRWSIWLFRKSIGLFYRPQAPEAVNLTVSIVTPVYNEDPDVFRNALESWAREGPNEIIAVIDHSDQACLRVFDEFTQHFAGAHDIITIKPGKRAALADGIEAATSEIVILVDSDTLWEDGVLLKTVTPFKNPKVGGVGTRQNVLNPETLSQRLFDIHLDSRYLEEIQFLAAAGDALTCISGRTAAYRRSAVLPLLDDLINETFFGKPCISGDDKRLTHLVQMNGWQVRYQENARVFTPGAPEMRSFLKQRLRWTRNSWRADLRAMVDGWVWKKPALAFHLVDRVFQPFATLIAPWYFLISLYQERWFAVGILLLWWFVSRTVKILPHLRRRPADFRLLPLYIASTFLLAVFKVFALFTLNHQGWLTRWDTKRLVRPGRLRLIPAYGSTVAVVFLVGFGTLKMDQLHQLQLTDLPNQEAYLAEHSLPGYNLAAVRDQISSQPPTRINAGAVAAAEETVSYVLQNGDTVARLSRRYGLKAKAIIFTSQDRKTGETVQIQLPFGDPATFREGLGRDFDARPSAKIEYRPTSNTIYISGWDALIDLPTLYDVLADEALLEYEGNGVYLLKANLRLGQHSTLLVEAPSVSWLKLKSDPTNYVTIIGSGSNIFIDGVKISSWNPVTADYDDDYQDGRSYIRVTNSRMDIVNADVGYLGFPHTAGNGGGVYGLSWSERVFGKQLTTGYVVNSQIHHNYFGIFTFGATGMVFRNNEIFENIQYGLDPHYDSNNFIVEHNYVHDNGNHGIIFSIRCFNNVIRWNRSENNRLNGIMLERQSNGNSVYENILSGNTDGIAILDSHRNAVFNNTVVSNKRGLRLNTGSHENTVSDNKVFDNRQYGVYLYDGAHQNQIWRNEIAGNETGVYIRSAHNVVFDNVIRTSKNGVFVSEEASHNQIFDNKLLENATGLYLKTDRDELVLDNDYQANKINIRISDSWLDNSKLASPPDGTIFIAKVLGLGMSGLIFGAGIALIIEAIFLPRKVLFKFGLFGAIGGTAGGIIIGVMGFL